MGIFAYFFGSRAYLDNLGRAIFYQSNFLPALRYACTGSFDSFLPSPAVSEFLSSPRATFADCAEVAALPKAMWGAFENGLIFLLGSAGFLWRLLGISWTSLAPISGVLTVALALSAYGLFRVFCRYPVIAAAMTFAFMVHPTVVGQMMHLRDFAKAPFMVAALALTAAVVLKPQTVRSTFLLGAATGAVMALALGFRPDVLAILPIAIAAPIFTIGKGTWREWSHRSLALWLGLGLGLALLRAGTVGIAPPSTVGNSFISHVFILGFAETFAAGYQEMADASYRVVSAYLDEYVFGLAHLFQAGPPSQYDSATLALLVAIVSMVPNDALMRIFYTAQAMHEHVPLIWGVFLIGTICVLWVARRRALIFLSFGFAFLTAVASLQFAPRHIFFFGIFGMSLGCLLLDCGLHAWRARLPERPVAVLSSAAAALAGVLVGLAILLTAISFGTFQLQEKNIAQSRIAYKALEWTAIGFSRDGQRLTPSEDLFPPKAADAIAPTKALFGRLTLRSRGDTSFCADDGSVTQTYKYVGSESSFKPWFLPSGRVRELYFPMVDYAHFGFLYLQFEGDISGCDIGWHIATALPPNMVPMELMVVDGQIQQTARSSWQVLAEKFIWE